MGLSTQAKVSALILGLCMAGCADLAWASVKPSYDNPYINKVVDSIYKAEGGARTRHPYGILSIKTSNPRKACYEVVNWRYAMWQSLPNKTRPDFITYLSRSYCPIGASNDPRGLNRHWVKNVNYFMGAK